MSDSKLDAGITKLGDCSNANFPMTADGEVYHLGIKKGQVANRVVTSGDVERINRIATTPGFEVKFERQAPRLFKIITGTYKGVEVSLVASLMGIPNMDFTVRELRAVVDGPMAIIRLGTCGTPKDEISIGDICVAREGYMVLRNPDGFNPRIPTPIRPSKYIITEAIPSNKELTDILKAKFIEKLGEDKVHEGSNASADSFYGSQGRLTPQFRDDNEELIDTLLYRHPSTCIIEMESAHMMHLAECATSPIYCTACAIVLAQRRSGGFLDQDTKHNRELIAGLTSLETIIEFKL
eukprot:gnl/Chilomastix_caulleri/464.p1 GENE.gnl/Chilomastix_caulleri/464~~gnl/Chilomastix_caulleri/464.p1  ORF type:complete len:295 (+),score=90.80 gnl/Chilomastix_caulleri/464:105-989(+)